MDHDDRSARRAVGTTLAASLLIVLSSSACSRGEQEAGEGAAGPSAGPPPTAQMRSVEVTAARVATGQGLFAACAACHGAEGEGRIGIGPRLNSESFLQAASDQFLLDTITNGRAGTTMIAWGQSYSPEQIQSLVAYIRSWKETSPAELDERPLAGDALAGASTFGSICAGCHGRTGAGYQETANGTGIGRKGFLDKATNGYLRYIVHNGKTGTQMQPFDEASRVAVANLSDQDIDDVIVHLRASAW